MFKAKKGDDPVKSVSGNDVMKALTKTGFAPVKQRGSHVKLRKTTDKGVRIVIVPLHNDLPEGSIYSIARQAGLTYKEFQKLLKR